jgi:hypothetical protein
MVSTMRPLPRCLRRAASPLSLTLQRHLLLVFKAPSLLLQMLLENTDAANSAVRTLLKSAALTKHCLVKAALLSSVQSTRSSARGLESSPREALPYGSQTDFQIQATCANLSCRLFTDFGCETCSDEFEFFFHLLMAFSMSLYRRVNILQLGLRRKILVTSIAW